VVGRRPLGSETTGEAAVEESDYKALPSLTLVFSDQTPDGCRPAPNNEQSESDRLGRVYSLMEASVSGVRAVLQILIGNRCTVDKAADSTCVLVVY